MLKRQLTQDYYPIPSGEENYTLVEYIWIGGRGDDLRSKTKVYPGRLITRVEDLDPWNYDGSSTGQAETRDSEIIIKPVYICRDPFRKSHHVLALCETFAKGGTTPALANFRAVARKVFDDVRDEHPWYGIEQEYVIFSRTRGSNIIWPFGWPQGGYPAPQGQYYCSVGPGNAFGRALTEAHLRCCIYAGLKIAGLNAEVLPSQWEFQIGPCEGISLGDELWMARYIMHRLCEEFNFDVSFEPKPFRTGDWNGSGAHINISTESTRAPGGFEVIKKYMEKFAAKHAEHLALYGENNQYRLTGKHETASMHDFKWGVADRGASVRIPRTTETSGQGYFEDRRPASNVDPYLASAIIADTMCNNNKHTEELLNTYKNFKTVSKPEERYL